MKRFIAAIFGLTIGSGCSISPTEVAKTEVPSQAATNACEGPYPSYWQDRAFNGSGMWADEVISNQPPTGYTGPVFRLAQNYPSAPVNDSQDWGWTAFDPFQEGLSQDEKQKQAYEYIWAVMRYIQAGNVDNGASGGDIENDWNLCENKVRNWYHMPFQTYDPLSGREFVHGLTREAPVTFGNLPGGLSVKTTMWAVGFYNAQGASTLGQVWTSSGTPDIPASNISFPNGTVVGKLLFSTATPEELDFLTNMPSWQINLSDPSFCVCKPAQGESACTLAEMSEQCPRTLGRVYLTQFDIAVRDDRAPTGWVFGTFVADGKEKAAETNPWNRISALGLMWGNTPPPAGQSAASYPTDPKANGFPDDVIFWDVVGRLNANSNAGHLGCNSRLNGPADNAASSCMSCHMTASVPDQNLRTPPIIAQFGGIKPQCATPPNTDVDAVYFTDTACGASFQGGAVVPPPNYASGQKDWIALDYSLQLSISLVQWGQWQQHQQAPRMLTESPAKTAKRGRKFTATLPGR